MWGGRERGAEGNYIHTENFYPRIYIRQRSKADTWRVLLSIKTYPLSGFSCFLVRQAEIKFPSSVKVSPADAAAAPVS